MTEEMMPRDLPEMELPPIGATLEATQRTKRGRKPSLKTGTGGSESAAGSTKTEPVKAKPAIERQCEEIKIGLNGLFGGVAALVGNFDSYDGQVLAVGSPPFVDACVRAARQDSAMRGWLLSIVHVSAYSDIALYGAMMLVPIMMHHFPGLFTSLGTSNGVEYSSN